MAKNPEEVEAVRQRLTGWDIKSLFTPDTEWEDIKITRWSPDTCDCVIDYVWSEKHPDDERVHRPCQVIKACPLHAHHVSVDDHHDALIEHNRKRGAV